MSLFVRRPAIYIPRQSYWLLRQRPLRTGRLDLPNVQAMSARSFFHTVALKPSDDSIAAFHALLRDDACRKNVNKINLCTLKEDNESSERYGGKGYSLDSWQECVSRLSDLPNLRDVSLSFHPDVGNPTPGNGWEYHPPEKVELRTGVLNTLFTALDSNHINVDTLSIEHLQDFTPGVYNTLAFRNVRDKLKSLHLKISMEYNEHGPDGDIDIQEKHDFFNHELNTHWLEPLQSQLNHLTIYGDDFWGVYPRWDPRTLHFPQLNSLSFGRWSIAHQWQIDWLLTHAPKLEELYLDDCPIVHALRLFDYQHQQLSWEPGELSVADDVYSTRYMYPSLRWSSVLSDFSTHLKHLKKFGMMQAHSWSFLDWDKLVGNNEFHRPHGMDARLEVGRYMLFDPGTCPSAWIQDDMAKSDGDATFDCCWSDWEYENDPEVEKFAYPKGREAEEKALKELIGSLKK